MCAYCTCQNLLQSRGKEGKAQYVLLELYTTWSSSCNFVAREYADLAKKCVSWQGTRREGESVVVRASWSASAALMHCLSLLACLLLRSWFRYASPHLKFVKVNVSSHPDVARK